MRIWYAKTRWHIDDIKAVRPHWSKAKCRKFLEQYEEHIHEAMITAGWEQISYELIEYDTVK